MRAFIAALTMLLACLTGGMAVAQTEAAEIQCEKAPPGSVATLPDLVRDWVIVLCTPTGQALAPRAGSHAVLWVTRPAGTAFMLDAMPRQAFPASGLSKYEVRFTRFAAMERQGEARDKTLLMWDRAFAGQPRPQIDRVVQMDAQSIVNGQIFNLFFYVSGQKPRWLVVCADQCNRSVSIEIMEPR
jgi:hypothetical protein